MPLTKNNPAIRAEANRNRREKTHDGKPVKPVLYVGKWVGHGRYVAAQDESGALVRDSKGRPVPFASL